MARPALVVVYGDQQRLAELEQALQRRFGSDYQILSAATPMAALDALGQLRQGGEQVAMVLADQWLAGMTGVEFLCQAHELHPTAKRVLLITYGDAVAGTAGLQAMALGQLDLYLNAPWGPPELYLYPAISEALSQWARSTGSLGPPPELVQIVGPRWSPRSHEFRDLLARNSISHGFYDAESEDGRRLLAQAGLEAAGSPVLLLFDGRVLVDPPTDRLAQALGTEVTEVHGTGRLESLTIRDRATEATDRLAAAALFIMIGAEPHTDWLAATVERDDRGFLLTGRDLLRDGRPPPGWPLDRPPLLLETSMPGVFAAGDIRHGLVKRVASAVGEGATAIQLVHTYLNDVAPAVR